MNNEHWPAVLVHWNCTNCNQYCTCCMATSLNRYSKMCSVSKITTSWSASKLSSPLCACIAMSLLIITVINYICFKCLHPLDIYICTYICSFRFEANAPYHHIQLDSFHDYLAQKYHTKTISRQPRTDTHPFSFSFSSAIVSKLSIHAFDFAEMCVFRFLQ